MFGIVPEGHPDPRRLVFHDSFPADSYPLRKDWNISEKDLIEWGEGVVKKVPYDFMKVEGEGVYEIPAVKQKNKLRNNSRQIFCRFALLIRLRGLKYLEFLSIFILNLISHLILWTITRIRCQGPLYVP